jgi:Ca2+-binding RTX toxin-like protein
VRRLLAVAGIALLTAPAAGEARVTLVATAGSEVALLHASTNQVLRRIALPGPAGAVTVRRDGSRAFAAGGSSIAAIDLSKVSVTQPSETGGADPSSAVVPQTRDLGGGPVTGLGVSPRGSRLYAIAGTRLYLLDAGTLGTIKVIGLARRAIALAVSRDGTLGAVTLSGNRVAMIGLGTGRVLRRVRVKGAYGAAFAAGRAWVSGRRGVYPIKPGARKAGRRIRLPKGIGGGVAASPDGNRLAIGGAPGASRAALVDLGSRRVHGFRSGKGPGAPAWAPDGSRVYLAEPGGLSLVSPFSNRRLGVVDVPGTAVVVQPGLARVAGTDAGDVLIGTRGRDVLEGLGGDDRLSGGRENDVLRGGEGNDTLAGGSYDDRLFGEGGDDFLVGDSGNDRIEGGPGIDNAQGGTGDDSIRGSDGDDTLDGGAGDDRIFGEAGNDSINGGSFGNDGRLYGGPGDDEIHGGRGSDRLIKGGDGADRLFGETGTENITGGDGDDLVDGGRARDLLQGNNGNDTVKGDSGDDLVEGGNDTDTVDGGSGADEVYGDKGNDLLVGGPEPDLVEGGDGDDVIRVADDSIDEVDCGPGNDSVFVEDTAPSRDRLVDCETVTAVPPEAATDVDPPSVISGTEGRDVLRGTSGPDSLFGKAGADKLFGGGGDDYVDGEWGHDELHGGSGDDTMAGRSGDDRIFGDDGDDRITGDRGRDRIAGGAGDDAIFGNLGPDVIGGGSGNDRINVVRGEVDTVRCGGGRDVVFADGDDRVAGDCEDVRR